VDVGRQLLEEGADAGQVLEEVLHVAASTERLAGARQDHRAHRPVLARLDHCLEELLGEGEVEGIEGVGPVERDGRDAVHRVHSDRLVTHPCLLVRG